MGTPREQDLQVPEDVQMKWDLDGCSLRLPNGLVLTWRDVLRTSILAALGLGGVMLPLFFLGTQDLHTALFASLLCVGVMMLVLPPCLVLGAIAAQNTGVKVRIEPGRGVSYTMWGMDRPAVMRTVDIVSVAASKGRVAIVTRQNTHTIRLQTTEHARFLAQALERAVPPEHVGEEAVPAALRALQQQHHSRKDAAPVKG